MKRQKLLTLFGLSLIIISVSLLVLRQSSTSRDIIRVLKSSPFVKEVTSQLVPRSDCMLIHLRQTHDHPLIDSRTEVEKKDLRRVQNEIYGIITNLQERFGFNRVYLEGLAWEEYLDLVARGSWQKIKEARQTGLLSEIEARLPKEYEFVFRLATRFDVHPVETIETEKNAIQAIVEFYRALASAKSEEEQNKVVQDLPKDDRLFGLREQLALMLIARDFKTNRPKDKVVLLIFGGNHDFSDNVSGNNKLYPFKFSLITVTPRSLPERKELLGVK